jgi:hypothetical protein
MYVHKYSIPQSTYIKYRGNTGQIDVRDTIISILAKEPGLYGSQIAMKIYNKDTCPRSFGYVYEVLGQLTSELFLVRNGRFYYLTNDAVSHDMAVTVNVAKELDEVGVDLTMARFLSSGIIQAGEQAIADNKGENWDPDTSVACSVAAGPVKQYSDIDIMEIDDEVEVALPEDLEITDPFNDISDDDRKSLKEQADKLIADSYAQEAAAKKAAEKANFDKKQKEFLSSMTTATALLGKTVEINPGKYSGQVVGTILEMRPTGVTFLITFSTDNDVAMGTVMPIEYSSGLTYKILVDSDED